MRIVIALALLALSAHASGAAAEHPSKCGPLPCSPDLVPVAQFSADGAEVSVVSTRKALTLGSTWTDIESVNPVRHLDARSDYILFRKTNVVGVNKLGDAGVARTMEITARSYAYFKRKGLADCWPSISRARSVAYISTDDAGQIVYFAKRWRIAQCGD